MTTAAVQPASEPSRTGYDVVVIGAGPAGCVAARRLADSGRDVLLVESGSGGPLPPVLQEAAVIDPTEAAPWFWPAVTDYRSRPGQSEDQPVDYLAGRGVGGGSLVNGAVLSPGDPEDFDRWRRHHGCRDWGADQLERWLASATMTMTRHVADAHGGGVWGRPRTDVEAAFDRAVGDLGHGPIAGSTIDGGRRGLLFPAMATRDGNRLTVAEALFPRTDASAPEIVSGRTVETLRTKRDRVSAVILDGGTEVDTAGVVLAAGSIRSPLLLTRSGLAPNAGGRLKNHASFTIDVPWPDDAPASMSSSRAQVRRVLRWQTKHSGPAGPVDLTAYLIGPTAAVPTARGVIVAMLSVVRSVGRLHLDGPYGLAIESGHLADPVDMAAMCEGFRHVARLRNRMIGELGATVAPVGEGSDDVDDLARSDDATLGQWLQGNRGPVYHAVSTCAMGPDDDASAVCWSESGRAGTVRGVAGIVVVDGSVFPDLVAGGLQLPIMAVADRIVSETLCPDG